MPLNLTEYQVIEKIYESSNSQIYRGFRKQDNLPVIFKVLNKVLNTEFPTSQVIGRCKLEYEITRSLDSDLAIAAYDFKQHQHGFLIVLEDFGGESLARFLTTQKLSVLEFLALAIKICEGIGYIHRANIIHKDINPSNIVFNPDTQQLKIIDFGIASDLKKETLMLDRIELLEGTLAYMSPEQTGRMNRSLDYRTDIYSMGVTFYEMLTGCLPFESNDPLELIHCHLAREPIAPHLIDLETPLVLSQIILKLLAKNAEDRYQSAWGVKKDVENCLNQLQIECKIDTFELARQEIADRLLISEKLYGRAKEVNRLLAAFERVAAIEASSDRMEMVLVSGYSGIGKSRLVQEIQKPIAKSRGYYISGKFDQYQRDIPYFAIIQAFQGLIKQLLTESEECLSEWRSQLIAALGTNSHLITQVIPSLEMIIGKKDDSSAIANAPTNMSASESQNRFNRVFQNFIQIFAKLEHPLVIFLDDLQWADRASLKLLELLATTKSQQSLLLIGAYRDNEVKAAHPTMQMVANIQQADGAISQVSLLELNLTDINQLIADTLHCALTDCLSLAELVQQKTGGNPFFMNEFLKSLYDEKLLKFEYSSRMWQWSIAEIQNQKITNNVVELMATKIQKLGDKSQNLLQTAACIGNQFDLDILVLASDLSQSETILALKEAIAEGLILPLINAHQAIHYGIELTSDRQFSDQQFSDRHFSDQHFSDRHIRDRQIAYKFVHDRIQQAAYSLISEVTRTKIHQSIGQQLLKSTPTHELEAKIFDIVNQLDLGLELISSQTERDRLAQLNLIASQKAKASTAYSSAFNFAKIGVELLGASSWQRDYELSLGLYQLAVETAFLSGDFVKMKDFAAVIFNYAENLLDKIKVYEIQIQAFVAQNQRLEAIRIGIETLNLLGIELPIQASQADVGYALQDLQAILSEHSVDDLLELPMMTEAIALAVVNILLSIAAAAYVAAPELYILVVLQLVKLSIAKGNSEGSCYGYAACGLILCGLMNQMEHGYQFGQLALQLLDRFTSQTLRAKTLVIVYVFINHWKSHLQESLPPLLSSYAIGVETGDFEFAAYGLCLHSNYLYFIGTELTELEREMTEYEKLISQIKQQTTLNWLHIYHQAILNLLGKSHDPCSLIGEIYNAETMTQIHTQGGDRSSLYMLHFHQLILCYLFENYDQAERNASQVSVYLEAGIGIKSYALFYFYDTLNQLAIYSKLSPDNREYTLVKVAENLAKIELWASHAPMNYLHKWQLIAAEKYRILEQILEAMEAYDLAIAGAKENGYIQEEALANELAAKFYLAQNRITIAKAYMRESIYCYTQWGSVAKVQQLQNRYSAILDIILTDTSTSKTISSRRSRSNRSTSSNLDTIDLESVIKAAQAIASEIRLDRLLATLMTILIENAGAETGYLLLPNNVNPQAQNPQVQWRIEAIKTINYKNVIMQSISIDEISTDNNFYVPISLVNYVIRTRENIILNNASQSGDFQNDPWIIKYQSKSLICMPLLNQGTLTAIVLLENNLLPNAFTPERVEILNLLSSQAAISIVKARLLKQQEDLNQSLQAEINDRQLAEKERDRVMTIIQSSTDIIGMSSPKGKVIWNNAQANLVQGLAPDVDVSNLDIPTYHPAWALEIILHQGIPAAIANGTWLGETALLTHEGIELPVSQMIIAHKSDNGDLEYISTIMRDISEAKEREAALIRSESTLQNLVAGTAAVTGDDFFPALAKHIAEALHIKYALVNVLVGDRLHALAFWADGASRTPINYNVAQTPCETVLKNGEFICDSLVQQMFPEDGDLVAMQADSYMGIALKDANGDAIGNLCILDTQPLQDIQQARNILKVFAARASAELQRKAANEELYQLNQSLELRVKQRTSQLEATNKELLPSH
jgi:predicted ATPase/GAF domain-containing protein/tRNA A-37 threonylcarbamoyl transferase component Bud32